MTRPAQIDHSPSQTLAKGLTILDVFDTERPTWGIRELARALDMNPATVLRLVATLESAGYLTRDPNTHRYALGPAVMKLANLYLHHNPLPQFARKVFESYSDRFEHNFYLGTLKGYQVVYLAALDGRGRIKVVVEPGGSTGLHTTALGKVLLAFQDDSFIDRFIEHGLTAYTPNSVTDAAELRAQIADIRRTGIGSNSGEHFVDIGAVAAPVFNRQSRVIAGVSLAYPRNLLPTPNPDDLIPLVREVADKITEYATTNL